MGNCLETKLKASVNNPNLEPFGKIKVYIIEKGTNTTLGIQAVRNDSVVASTEDGSYFYGTSLSSIPITTSLQNLNGSNNCVVDITNYYDLSLLSIETSGLENYNHDYDIPVEKLQWLQSLTAFAVPLKGSLSNIVFPASLTWFGPAYSPYLIGDIKPLAKATSLTNVLINVSGVSGTVEGFVEEALKASTPITSKSYERFRVSYTAVHFKGASITSNGTLSWAPKQSDPTVTEVTFNGVTVSYDGTNWKDENGNIYNP